MIYSTNTKYAAVFDLPELKGPVGSITLTWSRGDKNITMFDYNKPQIILKNKNSKSLPSKKRFEEIILKFDKRVVVNAIGISRDGSILDIIGREHPLIPRTRYIKPISTQLIAYYKKRDKLKVLYQYFFYESCPPGNIAWVLKRWTRFFAIDTNTREIDGKKISITSVIQAYGMEVVGGEVPFKIDTYYTDVSVNVQGNPETVAICQLISKVLKEYSYSEQPSFGIITDSELDKIEQYNLRTKSLLPGLYLPPNFHIMYATAEAARDTYMPNKLMATCDKSASDAFDNLSIKYKSKHSE